MNYVHLKTVGNDRADVGACFQQGAWRSSDVACGSLPAYLHRQPQPLVNSSLFFTVF